MISETEDIIIYQSSQPKMTFVDKNSTAVHSDKDCVKELRGLGTSWLISMEVKRKWGLKVCSLKMEIQKESVWGSACMYVMCNIVWLFEGYVFFVFLSCFPPFFL